MCTSQLKYCPLCRAAILYVQREDAAWQDSPRSWIPPFWERSESESPNITLEESPTPSRVSSLSTTSDLSFELDDDDDDDDQDQELDDLENDPPSSGVSSESNSD